MGKDRDLSKLDIGTEARYNGKGTGINPSSVNGIGTMLLGDYRPDFTHDGVTYASYYFLTFLYIPIVPLGCYRIQKGNSFSPNFKKTITRYKIYGTERWKLGEVLLLYLCGVVGIVSVYVFIRLVEFIYRLF